MRALLERLRSVLPLIAFLAIALAAPAYGCPNCRNATGGQEMNAWFWSIVLMAFSPFVIGGTFLGLVVRSCRKARRETAAESVVLDGR
jgi:hypothetical protein